MKASWDSISRFFDSRAPTQSACVSNQYLLAAERTHRLNKIKIPKWVQIALSLGITAVILLILFNMVEWDSFLTALNHLHMRIVVIVIGIFTVTFFVQAFKYWCFVSHAPIWPTLSAYMSSNFLFNTPGGGVTGFAALLFLLKDWLNPIQASSALLLDMFTKIVALLVLVPIGMFMATVSLPPGLYVVVPLPAVLIVFLLSLLAYPKSSQWIIRTLNRWRKTKWGQHTLFQKIMDVVVGLCESSRVFHEKKPTIFLHLGLGLFVELILASGYFAIAREISIDIPVQNWIWIHCLARIFSVIPITFGGLGTRETAFMLMRRWIDIPSGQIMTLSLLYSTLYIVSSALNGILFFWIRPKSAKGEHDHKPSSPAL